MSPLPTFYLHFTTFSGCSAPHHLAEIPNLLSWICFVGLLPKFTPRPSQDLYTEPLWNNSSLQDNFFCCQGSKDWHIMCQCSTQLTSQMSVCTPLSYFPQSPFLLDGRRIHFPLSCVLQFTLSGYLFPNRSILKETYVLHSVTSFILHTGCIFKYFI